MTSTAPTHRRTSLLRILRAVPALLWAGAIFAVSSVPGTNLPGGYSVQGHFTEYAILGLLVLLALTRRTPDWRTALIALAICSAYAVTDEVHQIFVPARVPDPLDWLADTVGAATAIALAVFALRLRASRRAS